MGGMNEGRALAGVRLRPGILGRGGTVTVAEVQWCSSRSMARGC